MAGKRGEDKTSRDHLKRKRKNLINVRRNMVKRAAQYSHFISITTFFKLKCVGKICAELKAAYFNV
jgi:hypothetical protein